MKAAKGIAIRSVRVPMQGDVVGGRTVLVERQSIQSIVSDDSPIPDGYRLFEGAGHLLIPGMIDVHIHGAFGFDMTDGTAESIMRTSEFCATTGCTGMLVTSVTSSIDDLLNMVNRVKEIQGREPGARILGMHIEGPYLNEKRKGMQDPRHLRPPNLDEMQSVLDLAPGLVRMVTLAPELPQALEMVDLLKERGVIASIGHSDATYEEALLAFRRGITHVTHCFNALRPIHHREPGPIIAAMEHENIVCEAIVDHIHLHPSIVRLLHRLKGNSGMVLITDAMQAAGLGDGQYHFGGHDVQVRDGAARLRDGNLASSTMTMNKALQKTIDAGIDVVDAITMATQTPADMLGLAHKGRLQVGSDADLVLLDQNYDVLMTMIEGRIVYER